jgi:hypothetical protein
VTVTTGKLSVHLRHLLMPGLLLGLLGFRLAYVETIATTSPQNLTEASDKEAIRERISAIIRETVKQGEGTTVDGVKFTTRVPPSDENVEEIKRFGDKAVPVLDEYFWSKDGFEGVLALRFLGLLGGGRIVEPLKRVVEKSDSPTLRELALLWLTQAPWDLAAPVIRNVAETDPDAKLRGVARDLLVNRSPQR